MLTANEYRNIASTRGLSTQSLPPPGLEPSTDAEYIEENDARGFAHMANEFHKENLLKLYKPGVQSERRV
jgi:hypothetical protein